MSQRYHILSMSEPPKMGGAYIYGLDAEPMAWSQEGDWLLLIVDHVGTLSVGARTYAYQPWWVFVISPGTRCRLQSAAGGSPCAFFIRFAPCEPAPPMVAIRSQAELGEFGPLWNRRFRVAMNRAFQMQKETRAILTDCLWSIAEDPGSIRQNETLDRVERYIEENLEEPLRVEAIAKLVDVSHNQLIRLFRQEHGVAPQEYIRHRRQHHACRMLLETELPVKQIAFSVGIRDLAQFNRLIRQAAGMSPTELRASVRPPNLFRT